MAQTNFFKEFVPDNEPISAYLERMELFFLAHGVDADKQVAVLLSNIGSKPYGVLRSLAVPRMPKELRYADVVKILKDHYEPAPLIIGERYRFHQRGQDIGESIADYVAELRRMATKCKFEETRDFLEESLRDRFVFGLRAEGIRKRLLTEPNLTFAKAIEIAQSVETASKDAQQPFEHVSSKINNVPTSTPAKSNPCHRCGQTNHKPSNCKFKDATCLACGNKGHIKRVCRTGKLPQRGQRQQQRQPAGSKRTTWIDVEQEGDSTTDNSFDIFTVGKTSASPIVVELYVNEKPLTMEVDTGAAVTIVSEQQFRRLLPQGQVSKSTVVLRTYTSEVIPMLGEVQLNVQYKGQSYTLTAYITKGAGPCLLGRDWLKRIQLDWKQIAHTIVQPTNQTKSQLDALLKEYNEIFENKLGTMSNIYAELKLKKDVSPKFHKPRPIPFSLHEAVAQELNKLEKEGVLKKVEHSRWAAPIVPVPKKDGTVRICGDYKVTINNAPLPRPADLFATLTNGKYFTKLDLSQAYQQMRWKKPLLST